MPSSVAVTAGLLMERFKVPVPLAGLVAFILVVLLGTGGLDTLLAGDLRNDPREIAFGILKFTCMQHFLMPFLMLSIWMILDHGGLFRL